MFGVIIRGRLAWVAAALLGLVLLIAGAATHQTVIILGGVSFMVFGLVFLVLSFVTGGATD
jgi:hypothetical protein